MTVAENEKELATDVEFAEGLEQLESMAKDFDAHALAPSFSNGTRGDSYPYDDLVVPVVVHVLYREEENNISEEQIRSQIEVLNRDFNGLNEDHVKIPEQFINLRAGAGIRFELADRDPNGNPTNGITRTLTTVESIGSESVYHRPERGGVSPWPQPHYMNVWVCELEGNALGFSILPSAKMSERDGIVMSPRAFGTMGTAEAPYDMGRTFVHEVGHYFGLRHLWGSDDETCESTDYIDDTPVQLQENFGCKPFPSYSCTDEPYGDMFMNFMDYGNDSCMLLFTRRQVSFMHLVLETNRVTLFNSSGYSGESEQAVARRSDWNIYPNPSSGLVKVLMKDPQPAEVKVLDILGRTVMLAEVDQLNAELDLSDLNPGVYHIQIDQVLKRVIVQ